MFKEGERRYEMMNKKGLSDIVTTALIILLVAVAVVAIWGFVGPALKGTGQQFNRAQTCIANQLDVTSCQAKVLNTVGGSYPVKVQVRRTLSDGIVQLKEYKLEILGGTTPSVSTTLGIVPGTVLASQESTASLELGSGAVGSAGAGFTPVIGTKNNGADTLSGNEVLGVGARARVIVTYEGPDKSIIPCPSLPLSCQTSSSA